MDALYLRSTQKLTRPEIEGRMTRRGVFKIVIDGLRARGTPNGEGKYETGRRVRHEDRAVFYPSTKASRAERRAAARDAKRAAKAPKRPIHVSDFYLEHGQFEPDILFASEPQPE